MIYFLNRIFLITFFRLFNRLKVAGLENIPKTGAILILSNHISYLDPPVEEKKATAPPKKF